MDRHPNTLGDGDIVLHRRMVGLGAGVHRMRFRSFTFVSPSHPAVRSIASALLIAAVPRVLRSNNRRAAGVRLPAASERRGVHEGGGIPSFLLVPLVPPPGVLAMIPGVRPSCPSPSSPALARKLFDALLESL
jgi:hypothetical protein